MNRECGSCKYVDFDVSEYPCNQCSFVFSEEWELREREDNEDE